MLNQKELRLSIISKPEVKASELNYKFRVPQELGGLKRELTVKRNRLKKLTQSDALNVAKLSRELGVDYYAFNRFLNKETNNPVNAESIYKAIYSKDLEELKPEKKELFSGNNKEIIRATFIEEIRKTKKTRGDFFSLPSGTCRFELDLNFSVDNKFHYVGVEKDQPTHSEMIQTIAKHKLRMSAILGKAKEVLTSKRKNPFTHMFIDYCGTFPTYVDELNHVFSNNLVDKNGLIGLTFSTREANTNNQKSIDFHRAVLNEVGSKDTPTTIGGIRLKLMAFMGGNYEFVKSIDYHDTGHMYFALIKRVR